MKDWQIVLKEIIKNCDMETRTSVEKHFLQALEAQRLAFIKMVENEVFTAFISVFGLAMGLAIDTWDNKRKTIFNKKCVEIRDELLKIIKEL